MPLLFLGRLHYAITNLMAAVADGGFLAQDFCLPFSTFDILVATENRGM